MKDKKGIRTYIEVLDKLLGCDPNGPNFDIEPGNIILLRGEPGAGKTTLGLQVLSQYIQNDIKKRTEILPVAQEPSPKVVFFSLERDPLKVLQYAKNHYGFFESQEFPPEKEINSNPEPPEAVNSEKDICIQYLDAEAMRLILEYIKEEKEESIEEAVRNLTTGTLASDVVKIAEGCTDLIFILGKTMYNRISRKKNDDALKKKLNETEHSCPIVFIDSLNVLVNLLKEMKENDEHISERMLLNIVCDSVREIFEDSVIIFTGEYHYLDASKKSTVSESFFCDIEIALFTEPIIVPSGYEPRFESPLGSNVLSLIDRDAKGIQTQSFCRVLRSRNTSNQNRRCTYDIIPHKGIEFYEKFPGDGDMILFSENAQQEKAWQALFEHDFSLHYPALRYDSFNRSSLQKTTAAQRRFRYVPPRTDLYLGSFDNYWINWYYELCMKSNVADAIQNELHIENVKECPAMYSVLNEICAEMHKTDGFLIFRTETRDKLKTYFNDHDSPAHELYEIIRRIFESSDEIDEFLSDFMAILEGEKKRFDDHVTNNTSPNRSCLHCMWCRNLTTQLSKELTSPALKAMTETFIEKNTTAAEKSKTFPETSKYLDDILNEIGKYWKDHSCDQYQTMAEVNSNKCQWKDNLRHGINKSIYSKVERSLKIKDEQKESLDQTIDKFCIWAIEMFETHVYGNLFGKNLPANPDKKDLPNRYKDISAYLLFSDEIKITNENKEKLQKDIWLMVLTRVFLKVISGPVRYRLLSPIPVEKVRLFGERKSEIIEELEQYRLDSNRPIHRPGYLFSLRDQSMYCSIPYDANIGFMVYRKDILELFFVELQDAKKRQAYINTVVKIVEGEENAIKRLVENGDLKELPNKLRDKEQEIPNLVKELVERNIKNEQPPKTWEEMIAFYLFQKRNKSTRHFLIDCLNTDSFLSTMLELLWNCGGNLRISPDYRIKETQEGETKEKLMRAFYLLALMLQEQIIPFNSTLNVHDFSKRYNRPDGRARYGQPDWAFARHWYSTLIEILSARKNSEGDAKTNSGFLWEHKGAELEIMQIPVSFSNYHKYGENVWHISCWGDWHLAMLSGTENIELGIDLVNNLMSSDSICERASSNANIPTVKKFYDQCGDKDRCINLPERTDIVLPELSYKDLKGSYFKHAKSRSQIFDYHHCMREFYSVLQHIHFTSQTFVNSNIREEVDEDFLRGISKQLGKALKNIEEFNEKAFLLS